MDRLIWHYRADPFWSLIAAIFNFRLLFCSVRVENIFTFFQNRPKRYQKSTYTLCVVQNISNAAQNRTFNLLKDAKPNWPIRDRCDTNKIVFGHFKRHFSANYDPFLFFPTIWLTPSALSCEYGVGQGEPARSARIFGPNHKQFRNFARL